MASKLKGTWLNAIWFSKLPLIDSAVGNGYRLHTGVGEVATEREKKGHHPQKC